MARSLRREDWEKGKTPFPEIRSLATRPAAHAEGLLRIFSAAFLDHHAG